MRPGCRRAAAAGAADGGSTSICSRSRPRRRGSRSRSRRFRRSRSNGSEYPLELSLKTADAQRPQAAPPRVRPHSGWQLCRSRLHDRQSRPEGRAGRGGAGGAGPAGPSRFPVRCRGPRAPVLWLTLGHRNAVADGFSFSPVFSAVVPPRPIADHAGFVTNSGSNTITVFDKHLTQAVAVIDACAGPPAWRSTSVRRRAYVACSRDDEILAIDVATLGVVERVRVSPGDRPSELALTPDGRTLVSVNTGSNSISFLDAASLARQERINVDNGPGSIVIEPSGRRAFVFNTLVGSISVVDVAGRRLEAPFRPTPRRSGDSSAGGRPALRHPRTITLPDGLGLAAVDPRHEGPAEDVRSAQSRSTASGTSSASAAATTRRSISTTRTPWCRSTR